MEKVYGFTNENLLAFSQFYNFDNAKILTVLGSGDQYFLGKLNGAKDITVFDINYLAWYHFILKYTAIMVLSYEDFMQMFVTDSLDNLDIYFKLRPFLPEEPRFFFDKLISFKRKFSSIKIKSLIFDNAKINIIPYFKKEEYYRLQEILKNSKMPKFYNCNLLELPKNNSENFDIALLSNIYHYISLNPKEYREFLKKINSDYIMALYTWILNEEEINDFLTNGFDIFKISGVLNGNDYIVNLSRKKQ